VAQPKRTFLTVVLSLCAYFPFGFLTQPLLAQTTQGLISGRLLDSVTGRPVPGSAITYSSEAGATGSAITDASGYYYLLQLSPGTYRVRVDAKTYQSQEVQEQELPVAARIELDFRLRPLTDVWESGQYNSVFLPGSKTIVTFFGPDVDPSRSGSFDAPPGRSGNLESSVSEVIDSAEIENLPLAGRDVYTMLVTLPGVNSDLATARGLGLSIDGQRPSSSNYLLDGLENNNYLTTGPLTTVAPEAIQEYRVSINNFSAEYGRTSGFVANAITRSGGDRFHGVGYFYLMNNVLDANGFQENLSGFHRTPDKQIQPGFVFTGPILKRRLYFSSTYEYFRSRSQADPQAYNLPATPGIFEFALPGTEAAQLLKMYAPPVVAGDGISGTLMLSAPVELDRTLAIQRFDYNPNGGKDKFLARAMGSLVAEPDFIWTPYPAFISSLHENTGALGLSETHTIRPNLTNEIRASYSRDDLHWNRPHSEIPTLVSEDGVTLPGSPAFYGYKNINGTTELLDNVIWARDRHLIKAGGGVLLRSSEGFLTAGQTGEYLFNNVIDFALDSPSFVAAAVNRAALPNVQAPDYNRTYSYQQYFGFIQDTYKITTRLTANYGLRYDLYGAPENTGLTKDTLVTLGPGSTLAEQLVGATLTTPTSGNQKIFGTDEKDWGVRTGAAYDLSGNGRTLLRGGFGTFYDRPFDNLWENVRNNSIVLPLLNLPVNVTNFNYLAPVDNVLAGIKGQSLNSTFPDLTLVAPNLPNGFVKSYFAGIEERFTDHLTLDVSGLGSYATNLITTDIINRDFSTLAGRYNPNLPDIAYRAAQGFSNYNALATVLRYRTSRGMLQATYTWSHSIDNQSDPLLGDFFNLDFSNIQASSASSGRAAFSEQFNPNVDRGNADFDQRQNLVLLGHWALPSPFGQSKFGLITRDWNVSALSAFRSGLPYTVTGTSTAIAGQGIILNNRVNILNPSQTTLPQSLPVEGGQLVLNAADFTNAAASVLGNSGRNAFTGPGFYSVDVSLARSFPLRWLGDAGRLVFRASAFNVLNHANLNNPDSNFTSPTFGVALYGRQGTQSGFPAVSPLNETPRQIQLSAKIQF
jgi:Carboxypeptidase regulatory-like domain/TonB-dependent Receptor Plug Domain